jgi:predicted DNA-binding transcriptional regulator
MQKVVNALIALGLTDKEARIYLALYKIGKATSYEVAKEAGIKRPTVYVLMEELRKRGLVLIVPHVKNQVFIAKDPHEFINEYQEDLNRNARDLLASLPTMSRPVGETNIIVFKGQGSLVQGLSYGLHRAKEKTIYAFYAPVGKNMKVRDEYFEHSEHVHKLGMKVKCIMPSNTHDEAFREDDKKYGFETKKINHKLFSPNVSVEICGDVVKMIMHKQKQVIVMEEKGMAEFYKQVFELLWTK